MDTDKINPPQWLGRPILDASHVQDLEQRAAINEFHSKMPRSQAEAKAHEDYIKEHRERAAAHHLKGMKAAQATGNHEDARKHWALYDLHMKALGKEAIGAVPPEIEKRMMEEGGKPVYKFKAHKGDLFALRDPAEPVAQQPMQKSDGELSDAAPVDGDTSFDFGENVAKPEAGSLIEAGHKAIARMHPSNRETALAWLHYCAGHTDQRPNVPQEIEKKMAMYGIIDPKGFPYDHNGRSMSRPLGGKKANGQPVGAMPEEFRRLKEMDMEHKDPNYHSPSLGKAEAKQCKWKLGERRCQRMVKGDYCHDHVDHWANKIKSREDAQEMAKGLLKAVAEVAKAELEKADESGAVYRCSSCGTEKMIQGQPKTTIRHQCDKCGEPRMLSPRKKASLSVAKTEPAPSLAGLASPPVQDAPKFHDTVEGFMGGLKGLPKGSPLRGSFITRHMNHGPFLQALAAHPQGAQVKAMLNQHLNGANAAFKPGQTVTTVK